MSVDRASTIQWDWRVLGLLFVGAANEFISMLDVDDRVMIGFDRLLSFVGSETLATHVETRAHFVS